MPRTKEDSYAKVPDSSIIFKEILRKLERTMARLEALGQEIEEEIGSCISIED